jgi:hypothetical protein
VGQEASKDKNSEKRTVKTSAMPSGMPGWPEAAFSTISTLKNRNAVAKERIIKISKIGLLFSPVQVPCEEEKSPL